MRLWYPFQDNVGVWAPIPTWPTHHFIARGAHFESSSYRYYNTEKKGFQLEWMIEDLVKLPPHQIILLHACAHNPTGSDPSPREWNQLAKVFKQKKHFAFFDTAYQGFASGDLSKDASGIRSFARDGVDLIVSQCFAKSLGLYGERIGCLHVLCNQREESKRVTSELEKFSLNLYHSPPIYGAQIAETVLGSEILRNLWLEELKVMAGRIKKMRDQLVFELKRKGSHHDWSHIQKQIGMFAFTGLQRTQVEELQETHHIFMTKDGRISLAGLNSGNLELVADKIQQVTKNSIL